MGRVLGALRDSDSARVDSSQIDTDVREHGAAYADWFRAAGLDGELANALYAVESDVSLNAFARDVGHCWQHSPRPACTSGW